jgi:hypothetical protein
MTRNDEIVDIVSICSRPNSQESQSIRGLMGQNKRLRICIADAIHDNFLHEFKFVGAESSLPITG